MTVEQYTAAVKEYRNAYLQEIVKTARRRIGSIDMDLFVKKLAGARPASNNDEESDKVMLRSEIETKHDIAHKPVKGKPSTCLATGKGADFKPNLCTCGYEIFKFGTNCGELADKQMLIQLFTGYIAGFNTNAGWYLYENGAAGEMDATKAFLTGKTQIILAGKGVKIDYSKLGKDSFRLLSLNDLGTEVGKIFNGTMLPSNSHLLPLLIAEPARNPKLLDLIIAKFSTGEDEAFHTEISRTVGQVWSSGYGKEGLPAHEIDDIKFKLNMQ